MQQELMEKEEVRAHYKQMRDSLSEEERWNSDDIIIGRFLELNAYKNAEYILTYLSMGSEVETRGIIQQAWEDGKTVALPRCIPATHEMEWYRVDSLDKLVETALGIWEPVRDPEYLLDVQEVKHALCVVPGLTFDRVGYRLGYGGGYYDRYFAGYDSVYKIAAAYDLQIVEQVPAEPFDLKPDCIVTESHIYAG